MLLILDGDPMPCPRPRAAVQYGRGMIYMPKKYVKWKDDAALLLAAQWRKLGRDFGMVTSVSISVWAIFDRPKSRPDGVSVDAWRSGGRMRRDLEPDADNIFKAVCDAIQDAKIVANDRTVSIGSVTRWYGAVGEHAKIEIIVEDI